MFFKELGCQIYIRHILYVLRSLRGGLVSVLFGEFMCALLVLVEVSQFVDTVFSKN